MSAKKRIISEKSIDNLIKEELSQGNSIYEIKTNLVEKGYDEDLVGRWTNSYFLRNYLIQAMFVVFFLGILPAIFLTSPVFTGYVVVKQGMDNYTTLMNIYPIWIVILMVAVFLSLKAKFSRKRK